MNRPRRDGTWRRRGPTWASRPWARALSARAWARSNCGQYAASASPARSYDFFSFFRFFGTPENSSRNTSAVLPTIVRTASSSAIPFTRRRASCTSSAKSCRLFANDLTRTGSPGVGSFSRSSTCQSVGRYPATPQPPSRQPRLQPYASANLQEGWRLGLFDGGLARAARGEVGFPRRGRARYRHALPARPSPAPAAGTPATGTPGTDPLSRPRRRCRSSRTSRRRSCTPP